ncbi:MAG: 30S ribosomal protein S6 [Dehalococcoidia bacterium CG2_30_46_9]|nr:MAG: 30S ribosomal protein S6 [Dehalococcoidia bacterium CG2_30_46_9]
MRNYELVTIISPDVDEEGVSKTIEKLDKSISDKGGTVGETNKWGRKKLAYPLKKFMEANYLLTRFNLEPKLVRELEKEIKSWEEVLRFLVVKIEN